jgi:glycosyltransferase involved in cell wall biosynthesis
MLAILDQLDPHRVDEDMTREEALRWEGWEAMPGKRPQSFHDRIFQEWAAADLIVVNSNFSRTALIQQGADAAKIVVVPLAYESEAQGTAARTAVTGKPLEVLWLGQVVLRKGIPYLFEAAKLLKGENVRFHVAGHIGISASAVQQAPDNVSVLGQVTRQRAIELYKSADVFVLPTISDGFAITQIEAMSYGLPVITTPNCGDVVTPGIDGEIIPIRDPAALAGAIMKFANDRTLLAAMSAKALEKSRQFTMNRYAETIERAADDFSLQVPDRPAHHKMANPRQQDGPA